MTIHPFICPHHIVVATKILSWAETYLMEPNSNIKRPYGDQTVCPFVRSSIESDYFYMVFHDEVNGQEAQAIADIIVNYIDYFKNMKPRGPKEKIRKALVIVFQNIPEGDLDSLDICHQLIKPILVENALMVGQFHPKCSTPAVHNNIWREVSVAPYPMIAIRHMAIHDILFLGNDREWFSKYNLLFGQKFINPDKLDEHDKPLIRYYKAARERFLAE